MLFSEDSLVELSCAEAECVANDNAQVLALNTVDQVVYVFCARKRGIGVPKASDTVFDCEVRKNGLVVTVIHKVAEVRDVSKRRIVRQRRRVRAPGQPFVDEFQRAVGLLPHGIGCLDLRMVPITAVIAPHHNEAFSLGPLGVASVLWNIGPWQHAIVVVLAPAKQRKQGPGNLVRDGRTTDIIIDEEVAAIQQIQFAANQVWFSEPVT